MLNHYFLNDIFNSLQSKSPGEMGRIYWELSTKTFLKEGLDQDVGFVVHHGCIALHGFGIER